MIRPFTFLCMVGALGSGLYLYQCKHQAQVLDREIARTIKQTEAARDRIGMLRAEWTQLNQPDRVSDLARAHTALQTAKPTQFVSVADLGAKLPAPVALPPPAPLQPTDVAPEETAPLAQATPPPVVVAEPAKPETRPIAVTEPPAKPVAEARRPDPKPDAKPDVKPVPSPVRQAVLTRSPLPAPMHVPAHHTLVAAPESPAVTVSVLRPHPTHDPAPVAPYVQPVAAPAYSEPAYEAPAYRPAYTPPAASAPAGSVLGGSRGLPPPVPFAAR